MLESELDENGIPFATSTDPANAYGFVSTVSTNFAAQTLAADQTAYYKQHDTDPKNPINRAGHRWSVRFDPPTE